MADDEITRMTVRVPDPLLARLRRMADRKRRSVHAQLLLYAEQGLARDERQPVERRDDG